jgi:hypothetical protein
MKSIEKPGPQARQFRVAPVARARHADRDLPVYAPRIRSKHQHAVTEIQRLVEIVRDEIALVP